MTAPIGPPDLAPAGPKRQQRGIQLPQLLLSLLVVAIFALLAVWWQARTTSRTPVVALAADVSQGDTIAASDLTEIFISSDVPANVVPSAASTVFVGARPITDLKSGTLITTDMFVGGAELLQGQAFVGLILDGTRAPIGIVAGDRVQVLSPLSGGDVDILAPDARVETATYSGGNVQLRLRLEVTSAQAVQALADQVVVIEIQNEGLAEWESEDPS